MHRMFKHGVSGTGLRLRLLAILLLSGCAGCVSTNSTRLIRSAAQEAAVSGKIAVPEEARKACAGARLPSRSNQLMDFGEAQTAQLAICDSRRALGVETMDDHNVRMDKLAADVRPRHWWEFWR